MATTYYDDPGALNHLETNRGFGSISGPGNAVQDNVSALPQIAQLTNLINSINQTAQQASNAGRIPGGAGLERQSSGNISTALSGRVAPDVMRLLGQQSAERGVASGSPGGANSSADYLRALGLTSFDLMNTGQNWLTQATNRNPGAPLFDPSSMLMTPFQSANLRLERDRLNRSGGGGGGGGGGRYPSAEAAAPTALGMNWGDLFGDGRGLTYGTPVDSFPYGIGTGTDTTPIIGGYDSAGNSTIFNPSRDFQVGSSYGGIGLYEDAFAGL